MQPANTCCGKHGAPGTTVHNSLSGQTNVSMPVHSWQNAVCGLCAIAMSVLFVTKRSDCHFLSIKGVSFRGKTLQNATHPFFFLKMNILINHSWQNAANPFCFIFFLKTYIINHSWQNGVTAFNFFSFFLRLLEQNAYVCYNKTHLRPNHPSIWTSMNS